MPEKCPFFGGLSDGDDSCEANADEKESEVGSEDFDEGTNISGKKARKRWDKFPQSESAESDITEKLVPFISTRRKSL